MNLLPLIEAAKAAGCTVAEHAPMAAATTFRVGGPADLLIDMPSPEAAVQVIAVCQQEHIPWMLIGKGSNLLVGDKGIRGAVLRLDGHCATPQMRENNRLYAPAGLSLTRLCLFAREQGLAGLEFAYGIPGSVGGAVYMNAGAYGGQMADVLESADILTPDGTVRTLTLAQLDMSYRHTRLMTEPGIVLGATLCLQPDDTAAIAARMKDLITRRQDKQPLEYPSAGSFFKRPEGHFAGALVEQAGMKGYRVGGAQVSEKHAGFVINRDSATAGDIRTLCADVQKAVRQQFSVDLEPEVRFIGEF